MTSKASLYQLFEGERGSRLELGLHCQKRDDRRESSAAHETLAALLGPERHHAGSDRPSAGHSTTVVMGADASRHRAAVRRSSSR